MSNFEISFSLNHLNAGNRKSNNQRDPYYYEDKFIQGLEDLLKVHSPLTPLASKERTNLRTELSKFERLISFQDLFKFNLLDRNKLKSLLPYESSIDDLLKQYRFDKVGVDQNIIIKLQSSTKGFIEHSVVENYLKNTEAWQYNHQTFYDYVIRNSVFENRVKVGEDYKEFVETVTAIFDEYFGSSEQLKLVSLVKQIQDTLLSKYNLIFSYFEIEKFFLDSKNFSDNNKNGFYEFSSQALYDYLGEIYDETIKSAFNNKDFSDHFSLDAFEQYILKTKESEIFQHELQINPLEPDKFYTEQEIKTEYPAIYEILDNNTFQISKFELEDIIRAELKKENPFQETIKLDDINKILVSTNIDEKRYKGMASADYNNQTFTIKDPSSFFEELILMAGLDKETDKEKIEKLRNKGRELENTYNQKITEKTKEVIKKLDKNDNILADNIYTINLNAINTNNNHKLSYYLQVAKNNKLHEVLYYRQEGKFEETKAIIISLLTDVKESMSNISEQLQNEIQDFVRKLKEAKDISELTSLVYEEQKTDDLFQLEKDMNELLKEIQELQKTLNKNNSLKVEEYNKKVEEYNKKVNEINLIKSVSGLKNLFEIKEIKKNYDDPKLLQSVKEHDSFQSFSLVRTFIDSLFPKIKSQQNTKLQDVDRLSGDSYPAEEYRVYFNQVDNLEEISIYVQALKNACKIQGFTVNEITNSQENPVYPVFEITIDNNKKIILHFEARKSSNSEAYYDSYHFADISDYPEHELLYLLANTEQTGAVNFHGINDFSLQFMDNFQQGIQTQAIRDAVNNFWQGYFAEDERKEYEQFNGKLENITTFYEVTDGNVPMPIVAFRKEDIQDFQKLFVNNNYKYVSGVVLKENFDISQLDDKYKKFEPLLESLIATNLRTISMEILREAFTFRGDLNQRLINDFIADYCDQFVITNNVTENTPKEILKLWFKSKASSSGIIPWEPEILKNIFNLNDQQIEKAKEILKIYGIVWETSQGYFMYTRNISTHIENIKTAWGEDPAMKDFIELLADITENYSKYYVKNTLITNRINDVAHGYIKPTTTGETVWQPGVLRYQALEVQDTYQPLFMISYENLDADDQGNISEDKEAKYKIYRWDGTSSYKEENKYKIIITELQKMLSVIRNSNGQPCFQLTDGELTGTKAMMALQEAISDFQERFYIEEILEMTFFGIRINAEQIIDEKMSKALFKKLEEHRNSNEEKNYQQIISEWMSENEFYDNKELEKQLGVAWKLYSDSLEGKYQSQDFRGDRKAQMTTAGVLANGKITKPVIKGYVKTLEEQIVEFQNKIKAISDDNSQLKYRYRAIINRLRNSLIICQTALAVNEKEQMIDPNLSAFEISQELYTRIEEEYKKHTEKTKVEIKNVISTPQAHPISAWQYLQGFHGQNATKQSDLTMKVKGEFNHEDIALFAGALNPYKVTASNHKMFHYNLTPQDRDNLLELKSKLSTNQQIDDTQKNSLLMLINHILGNESFQETTDGKNNIETIYSFLRGANLLGLDYDKWLELKITLRSLVNSYNFIINEKDLKTYYDLLSMQTVMKNKKFAITNKHIKRYENNANRAELIEELSDSLSIKEDIIRTVFEHLSAQTKNAVASCQELRQYVFFQGNSNEREKINDSWSSFFLNRLPSNINRTFHLSLAEIGASEAAMSQVSPEGYNMSQLKIAYAKEHGMYDEYQYILIQYREKQAKREELIRSIHHKVGKLYEGSFTGLVLNDNQPLSAEESKKLYEKLKEANLLSERGVLKDSFKREDIIKNLLEAISLDADDTAVDRLTNRLDKLNLNATTTEPADIADETKELIKVEEDVHRYLMAGSQAVNEIISSPFQPEFVNWVLENFIDTYRSEYFIESAVTGITGGVQTAIMNLITTFKWESLLQIPKISLRNGEEFSMFDLIKQMQEFIKEKKDEGISDLNIFQTEDFQTMFANFINFMPVDEILAKYKPANNQNPFRIDVFDMTTQEKDYLRTTGQLMPVPPPRQGIDYDPGSEFLSMIGNSMLGITPATGSIAGQIKNMLAMNLFQTGKDEQAIFQVLGELRLDNDTLTVEHLKQLRDIYQKELEENNIKPNSYINFLDTLVENKESNATITFTEEQEKTLFEIVTSNGILMSQRMMKGLDVGKIDLGDFLKILALGPFRDPAFRDAALMNTSLAPQNGEISDFVKDYAAFYISYPAYRLYISFMIRTLLPIQLVMGMFSDGEPIVGNNGEIIANNPLQAMFSGGVDYLTMRTLFMHIPWMLIGIYGIDSDIYNGRWALAGAKLMKIKQSLIGSTTGNWRDSMVGKLATFDRWLFGLPARTAFNAQRELVELLAGRPIDSADRSRVSQTTDTGLSYYQQNGAVGTTGDLLYRLHQRFTPWLSIKSQERAIEQDRIIGELQAELKETKNAEALAEVTKLLLKERYLELDLQIKYLKEETNPNNKKAILARLFSENEINSKAYLEYEDRLDKLITKDKNELQAERDKLAENKTLWDAKNEKDAKQKASQFLSSKGDDTSVLRLDDPGALEKILDKKITQPKLADAIIFGRKRLRLISEVGISPIAWMNGWAAKYHQDNPHLEGTKNKLAAGLVELNKVYSSVMQTERMMLSSYVINKAKTHIIDEYMPDQTARVQQDMAPRQFRYYLSEDKTLISTDPHRDASKYQKFATEALALVKDGIAIDLRYGDNEKVFDNHRNLPVEIIIKDNLNGKISHYLENNASSAEPGKQRLIIEIPLQMIDSQQINISTIKDYIDNLQGASKTLNAENPKDQVRLTETRMNEILRMNRVNPISFLSDSAKDMLLSDETINGNVFKKIIFYVNSRNENLQINDIEAFRRMRLQALTESMQRATIASPNIRRAGEASCRLSIFILENENLKEALKDAKTNEEKAEAIRTAITKYNTEVSEQLKIVDADINSIIRDHQMQHSFYEASRLGRETYDGFLKGIDDNNSYGKIAGLAELFGKDADKIHQITDMETRNSVFTQTMNLFSEAAAKGWDADKIAEELKKIMVDGRDDDGVREVRFAFGDGNQNIKDVLKQVKANMLGAVLMEIDENLYRRYASNEKNQDKDLKNDLTRLLINARFKEYLKTMGLLDEKGALKEDKTGNSAVELLKQDFSDFRNDELLRNTIRNRYKAHYEAWEKATGQDKIEVEKRFKEDLSPTELKALGLMTSRQSLTVPEEPGKGAFLPRYNQLESIYLAQYNRNIVLNINTANGKGLIDALHAIIRVVKYQKAEVNVPTEQDSHQEFNRAKQYFRRNGINAGVFGLKADADTETLAKFFSENDVVYTQGQKILFRELHDMISRGSQTTAMRPIGERIMRWVKLSNEVDKLLEDSRTPAIISNASGKRHDKNSAESIAANRAEYIARVLELLKNNAIIQRLYGRDLEKLYTHSNGQVALREGAWSKILALTIGDLSHLDIEDADKNSLRNLLEGEDGIRKKALKDNGTSKEATLNNIDIDKILSDIRIKAENQQSGKTENTTTNRLLEERFADALSIRYMSKHGLDYDVVGKSIILIDSTTGRASIGSQQQTNLLQATEARHGIAISKHSKSSEEVNLMLNELKYAYLTGNSGTIAEVTARYMARGMQTAYVRDFCPPTAYEAPWILHNGDAERGDHRQKSAVYKNALMELSRQTTTFIHSQNASDIKNGEFNIEQAKAELGIVMERLSQIWRETIGDTDIRTLDANQIKNLVENFDLKNLNLREDDIKDLLEKLKINQDTAKLVDVTRINELIKWINSDSDVKRGLCTTITYNEITRLNDNGNNSSYRLTYMDSESEQGIKKEISSGRYISFVFTSVVKRNTDIAYSIKGSYKELRRRLGAYRTDAGYSSIHTDMPGNLADWIQIINRDDRPTDKRAGARRFFHFSAMSKVFSDLPELKEMLDAMRSELDRTGSVIIKGSNGAELLEIDLHKNTLSKSQKNKMGNVQEYFEKLGMNISCVEKSYTQAEAERIAAEFAIPNKDFLFKSENGRYVYDENAIKMLSGILPPEKYQLLQQYYDDRFLDSRENLLIHRKEYTADEARKLVPNDNANAKFDRFFIEENGKYRFRAELTEEDLKNESPELKDAWATSSVALDSMLNLFLAYQYAQNDQQFISREQADNAYVKNSQKLHLMRTAVQNIKGTTGRALRGNSISGDLARFIVQGTNTKINQVLETYDITAHFNEKFVPIPERKANQTEGDYQKEVEKHQNYLLKLASHIDKHLPANERAKQLQIYERMYRENYERHEKGDFSAIEKAMGHLTNARDVFRHFLPKMVDYIYDEVIREFGNNDFFKNFKDRFERVYGIRLPNYSITSDSTPAELKKELIIKLQASLTIKATEPQTREFLEKLSSRLSIIHDVYNQEQKQIRDASSTRTGYDSQRDLQLLDQRLERQLALAFSEKAWQRTGDATQGGILAKAEAGVTTVLTAVAESRRNNIFHVSFDSRGDFNTLGSVWSDTTAKEKTEAILKESFKLIEQQRLNESNSKITIKIKNTDNNEYTEKEYNFRNADGKVNEPAIRELNNHLEKIGSTKRIMLNHDLHGSFFLYGDCDIIQDKKSDNLPRQTFRFYSLDAGRRMTDSLGYIYLQEKNFFGEDNNKKETIAIIEEIIKENSYDRSIKDSGISAFMRDIASYYRVDLEFLQKRRETENLKIGEVREAMFIDYLKANIADLAENNISNIKEWFTDNKATFLSSNGVLKEDWKVELTKVFENININDDTVKISTTIEEYLKKVDAERQIFNEIHREQVEHHEKGGHGSHRELLERLAASADKVLYDRAHQMIEMQGDFGRNSAFDRYLRGIQYLINQGATTSQENREIQFRWGTASPQNNNNVTSENLSEEEQRLQKRMNERVNELKSATPPLSEEVAKKQALAELFREHEVRLIAVLALGKIGNHAEDVKTIFEAVRIIEGANGKVIIDGPKLIEQFFEFSEKIDENVRQYVEVVEETRADNQQRDAQRGILPNPETMRALDEQSGLLKNERLNQIEDNQRNAVNIFRIKSTANTQADSTTDTREATESIRSTARNIPEITDKNELKEKYQEMLENLRKIQESNNTEIIRLRSLLNSTNDPDKTILIKEAIKQYYKFNKEITPFIELLNDTLLSEKVTYQTQRFFEAQGKAQYARYLVDHCTVIKNITSPDFGGIRILTLTEDNVTKQKIIFDESKVSTEDRLIQAYNFLVENKHLAPDAEFFYAFANMEMTIKADDLKLLGELYEINRFVADEMVKQDIEVRDFVQRYYLAKAEGKAGLVTVDGNNRIIALPIEDGKTITLHLTEAQLTRLDNGANVIDEQLKNWDVTNSHQKTHYSRAILNASSVQINVTRNESQSKDNEIKLPKLTSTVIGKKEQDDDIKLIIDMEYDIKGDQTRIIGSSVEVKIDATTLRVSGVVFDRLNRAFRHGTEEEFKTALAKAKEFLPTEKLRNDSGIDSKIIESFQEIYRKESFDAHRERAIADFTQDWEQRNGTLAGILDAQRLAFDITPPPTNAPRNIQVDYLKRLKADAESLAKKLDDNSSEKDKTQKFITNIEALLDRLQGTGELLTAREMYQIDTARRTRLELARSKKVKVHCIRQDVAKNIRSLENIRTSFEQEKSIAELKRSINDSSISDELKTQLEDILRSVTITDKVFTEQEARDFATKIKISINDLFDRSSSDNSYKFSEEGVKSLLELRSITDTQKEALLREASTYFNQVKSFLGEAIDKEKAKDSAGYDRAIETINSRLSYDMMIFKQKLDKAIYLINDPNQLKDIRNHLKEAGISNAIIREDGQDFFRQDIAQEIAIRENQVSRVREIINKQNTTTEDIKELQGLLKELGIKENHFLEKKDEKLTKKEIYATRLNEISSSLQQLKNTVVQQQEKYTKDIDYRSSINGSLGSSTQAVRHSWDYYTKYAYVSESSRTTRNIGRGAMMGNSLIGGYAAGFISGMVSQMALRMGERAFLEQYGDENTWTDLASIALKEAHASGMHMLSFKGALEAINVVFGVTPNNVGTIPGMPCLTKIIQGNSFGSLAAQNYLSDITGPMSIYMSGLIAFQIHDALREGKHEMIPRIIATNAAITAIFSAGTLAGQYGLERTIFNKFMGSKINFLKRLPLPLALGMTLSGVVMQPLEESALFAFIDELGKDITKADYGEHFLQGLLYANESYTSYAIGKLASDKGLLGSINSTRWHGVLRRNALVGGVMGAIGQRDNLLQDISLMSVINGTDVGYNSALANRAIRDIGAHTGGVVVAGGAGSIATAGLTRVAATTSVNALLGKAATMGMMGKVAAGGLALAGVKAVVVGGIVVGVGAGYDYLRKEWTNDVERNFDFLEEEFKKRGISLKVDQTKKADKNSLERHIQENYNPKIFQMLFHEEFFLNNEYIQQFSTKYAKLAEYIKTNFSDNEQVNVKQLLARMKLQNINIDTVEHLTLDMFLQALDSASEYLIDNPNSTDGLSVNISQIDLTKTITEPNGLAVNAQFEINNTNFNRNAIITSYNSYDSTDINFEQGVMTLRNAEYAPKTNPLTDETEYFPTELKTEVSPELLKEQLFDIDQNLVKPNLLRIIKALDKFECFKENRNKFIKQILENNNYFEVERKLKEDDLDKIMNIIVNGIDNFVKEYNALAENDDSLESITINANMVSLEAIALLLKYSAENDTREGMLGAITKDVQINNEWQESLPFLNENYHVNDYFSDSRKVSTSEDFLRIGIIHRLNNQENKEKAIKKFIEIRKYFFDQNKLENIHTIFYEIAEIRELLKEHKNLLECFDAELQRGIAQDIENFLADRLSDPFLAKAIIDYKLFNKTGDSKKGSDINTLKEKINSKYMNSHLNFADSDWEIIAKLYLDINTNNASKYLLKRSPQSSLEPDLATTLLKASLNQPQYTLPNSTISCHASPINVVAISPKNYKDLLELAIISEDIELKLQFIEAFFKHVGGNRLFQKSWYKEESLSVFDVIESMGDRPDLFLKALNLASENLQSLSGESQIALIRTKRLQEMLLNSLEKRVKETNKEDNELFGWLNSFIKSEDLTIKGKAMELLVIYMNKDNIKEKKSSILKKIFKDNYKNFFNNLKFMDASQIQIVSCFLIEMLSYSNIRSKNKDDAFKIMREFFIKSIKEVLKNNSSRNRRTVASIFLNKTFIENVDFEERLKLLKEYGKNVGVTNAFEIVNIEEGILKKYLPDMTENQFKNFSFTADSSRLYVPYVPGLYVPFAPELHYHNYWTFAVNRIMKEGLLQKE